MRTLDELIAHLRGNTRVLTDARIVEAFREVDRAPFVPTALLDEAYEDYALPIGHEQTISQPTTVAFMLELLKVHPGEKILDVGTGSGWTTALLAHLVDKEGRVYGVERIPELVALGSENILKAAVSNASIELAGDVLGKPEVAPYDRILVSASAENVPLELVRQLKEGGIMVISIQDSICVITRSGDGYTQKCHRGFAFVPLIEK